MKKTIYTLTMMLLGIVTLYAQQYRITPPPEDEVVVGAIGGAVDVTALGGASYSIPILIPEGIDGMQPDLSIVYNSQSGNGLLGWGWDLGGLSSITRVGQTLYHDGITGTLELNANDRFALDGQRLIVVGNSTYGEQYAEYKTEVDGMSKIISYTGHGFDGPMYFRVWTADGLMLEYGNDANARVVYENGAGRMTVVIWLLNRVENREGNYVVYNYVTNEHDYRLSNIQYSGIPDSKSTVYGIDFHYYNIGYRTDRESEAIGNYILYHPWLLKDISIYHWSQPLSKYEFEYDEDCGLNDSRFYYNRLLEISYEYDGAEVTPTAIDWGDSPTPIYNPNHANCQDFYLTGVNYNDPNEAFIDRVKFSGDFNGDGLSDVIVVGNASSDQSQWQVDTTLSRSVTRKMRVYLNKGHNKTDSNAGVSSFKRARFVMDNQLTDYLELTDVRWIYVCDFNGDGLDDIVTFGKTYTYLGFGIDFTVRAYKSTISQHGTWGLERMCFDNTSSTSWVYQVNVLEQATLLTGDFYGRGRADLIVANNSGASRRFHYLTYDESNDYLCSSVSAADWKAVTYTTCDYDGDGKTEVWYADDGQPGKLVKLYLDQNGQYTYYPMRQCFDSDCKLFIGDFNGDGCSDFLAYHSERQTDGWEVVYGGAESADFTFNVSSLFENWDIDDPGYYGYDLVTRETMGSMKYYIGVFDVDGDGKSDILIRSQDGNTYVLYGPLRKTMGVSYFADVEDYNTVNIGFNGEYTYGICAGNFLGQENMSILQNGYLLSSPQHSIYYNVQSVTDGMGNRTCFGYDYLINNPLRHNIYSVTGIGNNLGGYYIYYSPIPVKAVSRIEAYNTHLTFEAHAVDSCSYLNAMIHKHGKGFLGFERVTHDNWLVQMAVKDRTAAKHQNKTVSTYDHKPMGEHCKALLIREETFRYKRLENNPMAFDEVAESKTYYGYMKFLCNRDNSSPDAKVFIPVTSSIVNNEFEQNNGSLLRHKITQNVFNGQCNAPYLYSNAVRPTETRQGVDACMVTNTEDCEFQSRTVTNYMHDLSGSWVLNRPYYVYTEKTRGSEGFDDVKLLTKYTYNGQKPYLPQTVTTYPSGYESPSDKLATQHEFTYNGSRVAADTLKAINDTLQPRVTVFGYDQHNRFMTSMDNSYGQRTRYYYDEVYGTLDYVKDFNSYRQVTLNDDHLGITVRTFETDNDADATEINGTESVTALRWLQNSGFGQYAQGLTAPAYFSWKKSEGSAETVVIYDAAGRELRTVTQGLRASGSNLVYQDTQYDTWGRVYRTSEPYFSDTQSGDVKWTTYGYDDFDRLVRTNLPTYLLGNELVEPYIITEYDGLKTTNKTGARMGVDEASHTVETMANIMGWTDYVKEYLDSELLTYNMTNYEYNADGSLAWAKVNNDETSKIAIVYDQARNRRELHDPDYGTTITKYNAFGQLQRQQTPEADVTVYRYDKLGRLVVRDETDNISGSPVTETTTWTYSNTAGKIGLLECIALDQRQEITYTYDPLHYNNVVEVAEDRNGAEYSVSYLYSDSNFPKRVSSVTYPSGYTVEQGYDAVTGSLTEIRHNNQLLWETLDANAMGQITHFQMGNGAHSYYQYDDRHYLAAQQASKNSTVIQNFGYEYDIFGNLAARTEDKFIMPRRESFQYDHLNRLKAINLGMVESAMDYDAQGRIIFKEADGQTVFSQAQYNTLDPLGNLKPHAISSATVTDNPFPSPSTDITYTMFDKVRAVTQNNANGTPVSQVRFQYGFDHERISMVKGETYEKHYWGNCELISNSGNQIWNTFVSGPLGVFAAVTGSNNAETTRYIYKDHLGSWTTITDDAGVILQELSFDAWGNLRSPSTWSGTYNGILLYDRGFTGHEHLFDFGLVNMNGRMYDPVMSSFLSVDNFIQNPGTSQNFNRYSYCMNNPLRYTDPSGELFGAVLGVISDVVNNVFVRTFEGEKWDWTQTKLGWKIDVGLFHTDQNKSGWGKAWEIGSRLIWQIPQTLLGDLFVSFANVFGAVNDVTYGYGVTTVDMGLDGGAVTIGYFTSGPNGYKADWHDHLFVHEYGHYIQSQQYGPAYLLAVGIPSLQSAIIQTDNPDSPRHDIRWFEAVASKNGANYFDKYYGSEVEGYSLGNPDYFDKESFINGTKMPYVNPRTNSFYDYPNPISGIFHWTDIPIYFPIIGLFPVFFYL